MSKLALILANLATLDRAAAEKAFGKIITRFDYPPIPIRSIDWCATFDNYEPGDPVGRGVTEADAISDLLEQMEGKPE